MSQKSIKLNLDGSTIHLGMAGNRKICYHTLNVRGIKKNLKIKINCKKQKNIVLEMTRGGGEKEGVWKIQ